MRRNVFSDGHKIFLIYIIRLSNLLFIFGNIFILDIIYCLCMYSIGVCLNIQ